MEYHLIGICGGIGSGKSVVSRALRLRGEAVYDCDLEARAIMDTSEEVLDALNRRFGDSVCPSGGPICRPELARRIFVDDEERSWLNSLVHRLVRRDVDAWAHRIVKAGNSRCFVESAILASSGLAAICSEIIIVDAPEDVRIRRVRQRDALDDDSIRRRLIAQQEEESLVLRSGRPTTVIRNTGDTPILEAIDRIPGV